MRDITLISDEKVTQIPIRDCQEPLINIRKYSTILISQKPTLTYEGFTFVRETIAKKLLKVASLLPHGIKIIFAAGYRPLSVQKKIFDEYYQQLLKKFPNLDEKKLFDECTKFVANPKGNPPHSTGAAVD